MARTFNPTLPPQEGVTGTIEYRNYQIQMGEGASVEFGDGMNEEVEKWPLTWKGTEAEIAPLYTFLREHRNRISFFWTPPLSTQKRFVARNVSLRAEAAGNYVLTATFEQVYR